MRVWTGGSAGASSGRERAARHRKPCVAGVVDHSQWARSGRLSACCGERGSRQHAVMNGVGARPAREVLGKTRGRG
jgi:hypothetical protein